MSARKITDDDIKNICNQLVGEGKTPSADLVFQRHGAGNKGTILNGIKKWSASQPAPAHSPIVLPTELQAGIMGFIEAEKARAIGEIQNRLTECEQERDDLIRENNRLANDLDEAKAEATHQTEKAARLSGQASTLAEELKAAHLEAAKARQQSEEAVAKAARAELRLEAMPNLQKITDGLRADLNAAQTSRSAAEQEATVSRVQRDDLLERVEDFKQQTARSQAAAEAGAEALRLSQDEVKRLSQAIADLRVTAELATAELARKPGPPSQ